jgi:hypothetical protein
MEGFNEDIQKLLARRLLMKADSKEENELPDAIAGIVQEQEGQETVQDLETRPTEFVKIEKNLTALGFFSSASKKSLRNMTKVVSFNQIIDGRRVEAKVTIAPIVDGELPTTADQDKYIALLKLIEEKRKETGTVSNPVAFTSYELMQMLGVADSGVHYAEIENWLRKMTTTSVISEGAVYLADKKVWATDVFHVFSRAVSVGQQLEDGTTSDKNYVWLSPWQLENIKNFHQVSIDFDTYRKLKNHIAKALVPLLQIWLYASRNDGVFEKRYEELCQYLNIKQYGPISLIKKQLAPSLDELTSSGYLASWAVEQTSAQLVKKNVSYKIVFHHGPKFFQDRRKRLDQKSQAEQPQRKPRKPRQPKQPNLFPDVIDAEATAVQSVPEAPTPATEPVEQGREAEPSALLPPVREAWVNALVQRGVLDPEAKKLAGQLSEDQPVLDQLEYLDQLIAASEGAIKNPPGFYVVMLRENIPVPEGFETTAMREARKAAEEAERMDAYRIHQLQIEYDAYRNRMIDNYIATHLTAEELTRRKSAKKAIYLSENPQAARWLPNALESFAFERVRKDIAEEINLATEEAFCASGGILEAAPSPTFAESVTGRESEAANIVAFSGEFRGDQTQAGATPDDGRDPTGPTVSVHFEPPQNNQPPS